MQKTKFKTKILLIVLLFSSVWCGAKGTSFTDGYSPINVKERNIQGTPKGSTIQASIEGHTLTVTFTENLGQVSIEISTAAGVPVDLLSITTPNGYIWNIPLTGDYIITFTLPNGDEYYGEFTVTD